MPIINGKNGKPLTEEEINKLYELIHSSLKDNVNYYSIFYSQYYKLHPQRPPYQL